MKWTIAALLLLFSLVAILASDEELHAWEAVLHSPLKWESVGKCEASAGGANIEMLPDGAFQVPAAHDGEIKIKLPGLKNGVTALRLDFSKPGEGAMLWDLEAESNGRRIPISFASADFTKPDRRVIDRDGITGWRMPAGDAAVVLEFAEPFVGGPLDIVIRQTKAFRQFRLSVTTRELPVIELTAEVRETIALEPSERSDGQRAALLELFLGWKRARHPGN